MLNLNSPITLSEEQIKIINGFGTLSVDNWKNNQTKLRKKITKDLKEKQHDVCVYCGCRIFGVGDVEHIAHKAVHTEFLFTPKNLAYACKTCNQTYKGDKEIVESSNADYEKCKFNIVHPYLDDVDHFFDTSHPLIIIKEESLNNDELKKAKYTFKLLRWDTTEVTLHRANDIMRQRYEAENHTTISQIAIDNVLTFIP